MAKRLKVLCFHPAIAPYRVDFFNLLGERVELTVVFLQENLFSQRFDAGQLLIGARFSYRFLTSGFDLRQRCVRFGLRKIISDVRPDIVISYEASPTTLILCLMHCFAKWKLWTSMDDSPTLVRSRKGLRALIRDLVVRCCDGVIVPSSLAAEAYPCRGNFVAVPIIYDEMRLRKDESAVFRMAAEWRRRNLAPGDLMMLFVGRLSPEKNLKWLIEKASDQRWPKNLRLFLVGAGMQEEELLKEVREKELGRRVILLGRKLGQELYSLYAAADLFVLPSVSETFGAAVAESLHWGAKCLVSGSVGAKALITGANGSVFGFSDNSQFFRHLDETIEKLPPWNGARKSLMPYDLSSCIDNLIHNFQKGH